MIKIIYFLIFLALYAVMTELFGMTFWQYMGVALLMLAFGAIAYWEGLRE